jgi:septal ring factor EnvC (AmiA/AmiB activator)
MGEGANQVPSLYFEIRVEGKPIDPLPFLMGQK